MSRRRLAVAAVALAAAVLPVSASAKVPQETIWLVSGKHKTKVTEAQLDRIVDRSSAKQLRGVVIVVTLGTQTKRGSALGYKQFRIRAAQNVALSDVRALTADVEQWNADHRGYAGMTLAGLEHYDPVITKTGDRIVRATRTSYCIESTTRGETAFKDGPSATIALGRCS